jgi:hypothetical protein
MALWNVRSFRRRSGWNATHVARLLDEMSDNLALVPKSEVIFKEVIKPPLWLLAFIYFLLLSLVIAIWAAFDNRSALISLVLATAAICVIAVSARSVTSLDENELRIGRAHIEVKYLKGVELLSKDQMRLLRTREADPAAYLAITFWISTGVKITLDDKRDSTPYWLVSSKKAEELTRTLYKLL